MNRAVPPCSPNMLVHCSSAHSSLNGSSQDLPLGLQSCRLQWQVFWCIYTGQQQSLCPQRNLPAKTYKQNWIFMSQIDWELFSQNVLSKFARIASNANLAKGGDELRKELLERLIDCRLVGATTQISFQSDPQRLAMRELPHGSWSNVYLLYMSYCKTQGLDPASRSTFFGVSQQWRACLRFHKKSQHQVCETCSRLKSKIQNTKEPHQRYVTLYVWRILEGSWYFLMSKLVPSLRLGSTLAWSGCARTCSLVWCLAEPLHKNMAGPSGLLPGPPTGQGSWGPFSLDHRFVW